MAGTNEEQQVWTKRTMLLALDGVRKKLQRMPDWNEYTKNGLPAHSKYVDFFGMDRRYWAGKLKKVLPKLVKFQTELERRQAEGETLDDSKRSSFQSRDDVVVRMEGFERLFGFLPEEYEWEEFYPYFDLPDEKTRKKFFHTTMALKKLLDDNYSRIAGIRQSKGWKPLTYADFGVSEEQPTETQLNVASEETAKVLESKSEHEQPKPEPVVEVVQSELEKDEKAKAEVAETVAESDIAVEVAMAEVAEVAETEVEATETEPKAAIPSKFSGELLADLVLLTKNADFGPVVGVWRWVREISIRLGHLMTPEDVANIPGAPSYEDLELKLGARYKWKKIVSGIGLKDPLEKEPEDSESKPKLRPKVMAEALDMSEVEITEITPAEVVDMTEEKSDKVKEGSDQTEKGLIRPKVFASEDEAAEWLRQVCIECGYLINSQDLNKRPDWPSLQALKSYLGPLQDWGRYVADLNLEERPVPGKTYCRQLSFERCVKLLRDATKQNNDMVPNSREIAAIFVGNPSYKTLLRYLGPHDMWSKYLGSEYDYTDTINMVDFDSVLDELKALVEQVDLGTTEGVTNWLRLAYAKLQRFPTMREIRMLMKGTMSCTTFRTRLGLERKDWNRCLVDSVETMDTDVETNEQLGDEVEQNTMIEVDNMDDERKVETLEEATDIDVTQEAAIATEDSGNSDEGDNNEARVTKTPNVHREPTFRNEDEALMSLLKLRKKLGHTIRNSDFPAGDGFASIQTYMTMLSSRKNWDDLLDYYEEHGFDETLREMIELSHIRQTLGRDDATKDDLLVELAKIYLKYNNKIPSAAAFKADCLWPSRFAFKRCLGEVRGWKKLVLDYLERHPEMIAEGVTEENADIEGEVTIFGADDAESVDDESAKPEVEVETNNDPAAKNEAVQTVSVPKVHVKVPKDGKGTINLTLTINLQISFGE